MKTKKVRITTLTGYDAMQMEQALDDSGIVLYRKVAPGIIDVYTEKIVNERRN